jgi:hypothetical protein
MLASVRLCQTLRLGAKHGTFKTLYGTFKHSTPSLVLFTEFNQNGQVKVDEMG